MRTPNRLLRVAGALVLLVLNAFSLPGCSPQPAWDATTPGPDSGDAELVLYTSLSHESVIAIAEAWREESGVTVSFLIDDAETLIDKMVTKAHYPGADLLLVTDSVSISQAVDQDVLRPLQTSLPSTARADLPRDPDGYWQAVGTSADLIVARDTIELPETYADLGKPRYKDTLCLRRGSDRRSVALAAGITDRLGGRDSELAVRGWRFNLATTVFDNEPDLLAAIFSAACGIGIVDSRTVAAVSSLPSGIAVGLPTDMTAGVHVHPLAAGVSRHARDPETAARFISWLLSPQGQAVLEASGAAPRAGVASAHMRETLPYYLYEDAELLIERARYR